MLAESKSDELQLHLKVVGTFLEKLSIYRRPRIEAVKDMVSRVLSGMESRSATYREIRNVLCFESIPLVASNVLNQALQSLVYDGKLSKAKSPRGYVLECEVEDIPDSISAQIEKVWKHHFSVCPSSSLIDFSKALSLLFARFGCGAYDSLRFHSAKQSALLASVLRDALVGRDANYVEEFSECFEDFISSSDPDAAQLKFQLASAYV